MKPDRKFLRQCACCKEYKDKNELIRITKDNKTGEIILNNNNEVTGRSCYICKNAQCIETALKKKKIDLCLKAKTEEKLKEALYTVLKK